jgi:dehydrogenase/reductase SDR family protein 1
MVVDAAPLAGHVAVVTGSSRGIGRGIAESLGAAGATVYVTGRTSRPEDAPIMFGERIGGTVGEVAEAVTAAGGVGVPVVCDLSDDAQVEALIERVIAEHGKIDLLVNNAMIVPEEMQGDRGFWQIPLDVWDRLIQVGSALHTSRATTRRLTW